MCIISSKSQSQNKKATTFEMLNAFFADQLIIQKRILDFSITTTCRGQFEAAIILYCTYSPSTALVIIKSIKYVCVFRLFTV